MKSEICKAHQKVNHVELALLPSTRMLYWLALLEVCGKMKKYCKLDTFTTERLKRGTNRNLEVRSSLSPHFSRSCRTDRCKGACISRGATVRRVTLAARGAQFWMFWWMVGRIENCHLLVYGPAGFMRQQQWHQELRILHGSESRRVILTEQPIASLLQGWITGSENDIQPIFANTSSGTVGWSALKPQVVEQEKQHYLYDAVCAHVWKKLPNTRTASRGQSIRQSCVLKARHGGETNVEGHSAGYAEALHTINRQSSSSASAALFFDQPRCLKLLWQHAIMQAFWRKPDRYLQCLRG